MHHPALLLLACVIPLAACNNEPEVSARNASVEDVAKQVADARGSDSFVRPGKWESRVQIEEFTLPGAPPEAAAMMGDIKAKVRVDQNCLTPEDAKRPNEDFFAGGNKNCRYDRFTMGDGKIDAVMKCNSQGMSQTMAMQGSYGPDAYQMQMSMEADAKAGPAGAMTMKMRVDGKRVGECDKKAA